MNSTNYYELSQIEPTDKPTWLVMYNSDMLKIDTGIHEAKATADSAGTAAAAAQSTADTATSNLATLSGTVGSLASELTTAIGNINTINSLIGNGTPTTTDQTIIGAINELHSDILAIPDVHGLEVLDNITGSVTVNADGVKSYSDLCNDLAAALLNKAQSLAAGHFIVIDGIYIGGIANAIVINKVILNNASTSFAIRGLEVLMDNSNVIQTYIALSSVSGGSAIKQAIISVTPAVTIADKVSDVPSADKSLSVYITEYQVIS